MLRRRRLRESGSICEGPSHCFVAPHSANLQRIIRRRSFASARKMLATSDALASNVAKSLEAPDIVSVSDQLISLAISNLVIANIKVNAGLLPGYPVPGQALFAVCWIGGAHGRTPQRPARPASKGCPGDRGTALDHLRDGRLVVRRVCPARIEAIDVWAELHHAAWA